MIDSTLGYYRQPALCGDSLIFVCENDLWRVALSGGEAQRLTANRVECFHPVVSPDQNYIVYAAQEEGISELYKVAVSGGHPQRLTYLGSRCYPVGFGQNGDIVLASNAGLPFARDFRLKSLSLQGGSPQDLPVGPAVYAAFDPAAGRVALVRNTLDYARWKRYRGGRVGEMWIDCEGKGVFKSILASLGGNVCYPLWFGDRLYFLSDHEQHGNLYSCNYTGDDIRRETDHEDYYVRAPTTDGKTIAYQCGGDLYTFDPKVRASTKVEVRVHSHKPQLTRKFVDASAYLTKASVSPDRESLVLVSRGKVFNMPLWEGAVQQIGKPDGVRYRLASPLPDGKRFVVLSDEAGEEGLEVHGPRAADGSWPDAKTFPDFDIGRLLSWDVSPAKNQILACNQRGEVLLIDFAAETCVVIDRSDYDEASGPCFSPDGKWIAYAAQRAKGARQIFLAEVATAKIYPVTDAVGDNYSPAFDPKGRYLYFLSSRSFDPVYDKARFSLGFPLNVQLFLVTLRTDLLSPFAPKKGANPETPAKSDNGDPTPIRVDPEGLQGRMIAFPLPEGRIKSLVAATDRVFYLMEPVKGALNLRFFDEPSHHSLHQFVFEGQKAERLYEEVKDMMASKDGKSLVYRSGRRLRVIPIDKKPDAKEKRPGKASGWVDLRRVSLGVVPLLEWRQMYRELWRLQREHFWTSDLSKIDWDEVYARYLPLLDRIADRAEFSDFAWEVQGELGTSHAYEMGGDRPAPPPYRVGFLGGDFAPETDGWKVVNIPSGDGWHEGRRSPLRTPGVFIDLGDVLLTVDGQKVDPKGTLGEALTNKAGRYIELGCRRGSGKIDVVTVKTLADETVLRYRDWVNRNRAFVQEKSGGTLGYLHIPDMGPGGYSEFFRYLPQETQYEGLIVDVRFNGGGHVSPFILEKLAAKRVGYRTSHHSKPYPRPMDSVEGPIVCLTDENAGSDGDIFSHSFKMLAIGPLVGRRTWGGVVGIQMRNKLVDGTLVTQPEFSTWFHDVEFGVENYGTDPDVEVTNTPMDWRTGYDRQLHVSIETALNLLKSDPPSQPDFSKRPVLTRKPLVSP